MVDKINKVSNPLTIIAIFAGLAEVAATVALGLIDSDIQKIFIWFVMLFPALLVISFFLVLWVKPEHLYAPSDYSDENNFMKNVAKLQAEKYVEAAMNKVNEASLQQEVKNELLSDLNNAKVAVDSINEFSTSDVIKYVFKRKFVYRILELLNTQSKLSVNEIASMLGISHKVVFECLKQMEDLLLVSRETENHEYRLSTYTITKRGTYILRYIPTAPEKDMIS